MNVENGIEKRNARQKTQQKGEHENSMFAF
jgi:hypothetical protein